MSTTSKVRNPKTQSVTTCVCSKLAVMDSPKVISNLARQNAMNDMSLGE